jgi:DNA anti-recombination protein RmuC
MQQQIQQMLHLLQQLQQGQAQSQHQIQQIQVSVWQLLNEAARSANARITNTTEPLREVPRSADGVVPPNFPETPNAFQTLAQGQVTELLNFYLQPANGSHAQRRIRLQQYLGILPGVTLA